MKVIQKAVEASCPHGVHWLIQWDEMLLHQLQARPGTTEWLPRLMNQPWAVIGTKDQIETYEGHWSTCGELEWSAPAAMWRVGSDITPTAVSARRWLRATSERKR